MTLTRTVTWGLCGGSQVISCRVEYWTEDALGHPVLCCANGIGCNGLPFNNCDFSVCNGAASDPWAHRFAKIAVDIGETGPNAITGAVYDAGMQRVTLSGEFVIAKVLDPFSGGLMTTYEFSTAPVVFTDQFTQPVIVIAAMSPTTGKYIGVCAIEIDNSAAIANL